MSDFTSNFWSMYVAGITAVGIAGCLILLWVSGSTKTSAPQKDNTTGHVWDEDLREMNNPLPLWWVVLFVVTCVFSIGYLVWYPGFGAYEGMGKWSSAGQFEEEVAKDNARSAPVYASFAGKSIEALSRDKAAMDIGDRLYMNNCAQCHGSSARGSVGYPNLTDKQWNWGGTPDDILTTITHGRTSVMTPMAAALEGKDDVRNVANYVLSLSGAPHNKDAAAKGREKFEFCAACHGPDGKGMKMVGSANLASGIFTHGPVSEAHIIDMINNGKTGVMPAWEDKFTPAQLRVLAAYIWGKGGGEPAEAPAAAK